MPREVYIGARAADGVVVGGVRVPVIAGLAGAGGGAGEDGRGADMVQCRPRRPADARDELGRARSEFHGPLLVEIDTLADSRAVAPYADGVIVDAAQVVAGPSVSGAPAGSAGALTGRPLPAGLPVIVRRGPSDTLDTWLEAAQRCAAAGAADIVLWEGGAAQGVEGPLPYAPDLALLSPARARTDAPIVVDVTAAAELAGPAVTAGADGLALARDAGADELADAVELATTLAPFGRRLDHPAWLDNLAAAGPGSLAATRHAIDQVDACLANLLERRASLAGLVQRLKPVGGFAGRDLERERALVTAMARRAPRLGPARMRRIMEVVIEAGLELAESEDPEQTGRSGTRRSVSERDVSQAR